MIRAQSALFHFWTKASAPEKFAENAEAHFPQIDPLNPELHCTQLVFAGSLFLLFVVELTK